MKAVLQALLDLQVVDRDLHKVQIELKRLPKERAARRTEIDKLLAKVADLRTQAKTAKVKVKEFEDAATTSRQRMRKLENDAANSRADMALLAHFQHEIKNLKRDIGNAEEQGIALLEQIEGYDKEAAEIQKKVDDEEKIFAEFASNVERETTAADAKRATLEAERKKRMGQSSIPPEALSTYTRLLVARDGTPLAALDGRTCQACYIEMPTNMVVRVARGSELVPCPSCDRILYIP
ncbi:MAG: C4-type zinc ribbon domain-containing protein [Planctomycetota bacterium]|nr:C4-type zinc ribbon domain-containing protein [Planctomycetota bacterium]